MHCFANNLPFPDERERAEDAVIAGIGEKASEVARFSIVAGQDNANWQVKIILRGHAKPLFVDIYEGQQGAEHISEAVASALARVDEQRDGIGVE
jgi:hypothetical protein